MSKALPLLEVKKLKKYYSDNSSLFKSKNIVVKAVDDDSFNRTSLLQNRCFILGSMMELGSREIGLS